MESRGRPSEQVVKLDKWVLDTEDSTWYYDKSKSTNGCWMVELSCSIITILIQI